MDFSEIKSRIVELNNHKNSFAKKKMDSDVGEKDEKELISSLIYLISELRKCASELGISDDGKKDGVIPNEFLYLNDGVKNLKTQIIFLTRSSPDMIKEEMNKQNDTQRLDKKHKKEIENKNNDSTTRLDETRERLKQKLKQIKEH